MRPEGRIADSDNATTRVLQRVLFIDALHGFECAVELATMGTMLL
jgi:hypothetical protein